MGVVAFVMLRYGTGLFAILLTSGSALSADIAITLDPFDQDGAPVTAPVPAGSVVLVDILLSADAGETLADVRQLRFDFSLTSPALELGAFTWTFDSLDSAALYLTDEDRSGLQWEAAFTGLSGAEGRIVNLDATPVRVATLEVTVNGTGTLDALGPANPGTGDGAFFWVGFLPVPEEFSLPLGNITGGTVTLRTEGVPLTDRDGDGVADDEDAFPDDSSEWEDADGDGTGDNADPDDDNDNVPDDEDAFPFDPDESLDTDGDGVGNKSDEDDDGDGVADDVDAFPLDPEENADSDGDGVGDVADAFPQNPGETLDSDHDGVGDNSDPDDDNDGVADADDEAPFDPLIPSREANTNRGQRVTGSLCGLGLIGPIAVMVGGLISVRASRRRCRSRRTHI
ncbi:MAG: thrombospondin type 3 repeat-containing protein [Phycisphaerae bacterium]